MNLPTLPENREDQDVSAYYPARCLGFIEYDASLTRFRESKALFRTENPASDFLYKTHAGTPELGMPEFNGDDQYRRNRAFKHS